jgi:WD40 repeat protein
MEGRIALVDKDSKEIVHEFMQDGGSIFAILIYQSDKFILVAGKDGKIRKFMFNTFELNRVFDIHEKEINALALSIDEKIIFSASDDGNVRASEDLTDVSRVLYAHEKAALSLDRSLNGELLVSGGSDKQIIIFNLVLGRVQHVLSEFNSGVWSVKFSRNLKYLAAGDANASIKVWKFGDWEQSKSYVGHTKRISRLEFNSAETTLFSSSNDCTLRMWSLDLDKNELILSGHTDWVKDFKISPDEKFIFSIAENYKIIVWYVPRFDTSFRVKGHKSRILQSCYAKQSKLTPEFLFTSDQREIKVWEMEGKTVYKTLVNDHEVTSICVCPSDSTLIAAYSNKEVMFWSIDDETAEPKLTHPSLVRAMMVSPDSKFLAIGDANFRVTIYNKRSLEALGVFRRHSSIVTTFAFSKPFDGDCEMMFSAGADGLIFMYTLKFRESSKIGAHMGTVTALCVSRNNELLVSGDELGTFKIWNILKVTCIKTVEKHVDRITGIYFNENSKYFWISSMDSSISLWNSTSFSEVTHLCTKYPISSFSITAGETHILIAENDEVYFLPNILNGKQFFIYGPGREYYSFMRYLMRICEGNEQAHDPDMDKWIISPFEFNALHLYSYFNLPQHLRAAMSSSSPFFSSKSGFSPIQIAIDRNFRDCINEIIKSIRLKVQEDPYMVGFLEDHIVKLNELGFRGLDEFYESILFSASDKLLPKFVSPSASLPVLIHSRSLGPQTKDFFPPHYVASEGLPVHFLQSALKVDSIIGSENSIQFLESLVNSPNSSIFTTQFVKDFVLHKWKYVKWLLIPQAILYFFYMIMLSYYLIRYEGEKAPSVVVNILEVNVLLILYEIFQMFLTKSLYFYDIWNYIDMARSATCFIYCIFSLIDFDDQVTKQLLVSVTFLSMMRGISYFRLFDETRYMINLLNEVFKDMTSFLILLFYSTFSFALIYFIMVNNLKSNAHEDSKVFSSYIATSYLLNLGDFDTDNYGLFEWIIFFFASVINPLIMLNLLISIMGDTYGRVKEEKEIADMKELTQMVIEGEYLLFCKRKQGKKTYMQICELEQVASEPTSHIQRIGKLKKRLKGIQNVFTEKHEENKIELKHSMDGISTKLDEMTTLVEQINVNHGEE